MEREKLRIKAELEERERRIQQDQIEMKMQDQK
jgi:hypothetical protein